MQSSCQIFHYPNKPFIRPFAFIFLIVLVSFTTRSQQKRETGLQSVYNFSEDTYNATPQNRAVVQDNRGIMYFANNQGVLVYDGIFWKVIQTNSPVHSLAVGKEGRIYAGSENEFGYLIPDSIGQMEFRSLREYLPEEFPDFNEVRNTFTTDDQTIFQTNNHLFLWNGDSMQIINSEETIHESFLAGGIFYSDIAGMGLARLENNSLKLLTGGQRFADMNIYGIIEIEPEWLIVATQNQGLFNVQLSDVSGPSAFITRLRTEADEYLRLYTIYNAVKIDNNRISLGTWGGGVVIIDIEGKLMGILDKNYGLQGEIIQDQFVDERGNLWLGLNKGISRVEVSSPLSFYTDQAGLAGTIESISRFNNQLYAATSMGLFYLTHTGISPDYPNLTKPLFRRVEKFSIECWNLLTYKHDGEEILLVVTNNDVTEVDKNQNLSIVLEEYAWYLYQSRVDPSRVYVGLDDGLISLYRENREWRIEDRVEGIDETILHLSEDTLGNLWMGTEDQGVIKLDILSYENNKLDNISITKFDTADGLPSGEYIISQAPGYPVIGTHKGIFKYEPDQERFIPDPSFGTQFADGSLWIHKLTEQSDENIWMFTFSEQDKDPYDVGYLTLAGGNKYEWITGPFTKVTEGLIQAIYPDRDQVTWFGGSKGLFRFDARQEKDYTQDYNTYIRDVTVGDGERIFGGTYFDEERLSILVQPPDFISILPYSKNSLIFYYASQMAEDEEFAKFSYFLDGYDKRWSEWTTQTKKEYTNLWEGTYSFLVRSKNIYGHEGLEASFTFTIQAPWFRTIPAYIAYFLLAAGFVYGVVRVYTRHLRAIIRERTAEVVQQKEEIEEKNVEITDSIQYASRIQSAILPPGDYIDGFLPHRFILYLPRDIVSGDFYWLTKSNGKVITVAADCTGHGVPGAFMSMLGVAFLNEIISKHADLHAHEILNQLRDQVIKSLRQTGKEGESKDGMDIALCILDLEKMEMEFSGANNPLLLIRDNELLVYKADKMPIGIHQHVNESFSMEQIPLKKGDLLYTFSDGYVDQFGGPMGKKFMSKRFKELLIEIHEKDMQEQNEILKNTLYDWMKETEQVDDVIVMGVKI